MHSKDKFGGHERLLCQVLTDNSDIPFEHLQPEDGIIDTTVPVHPFQQRIEQLSSTPPSVLARCCPSTPSHLLSCMIMYCMHCLASCFARSAVQHTTHSLLTDKFATVSHVPVSKLTSSPVLMLRCSVSLHGDSYILHCGRTTVMLQCCSRTDYESRLEATYVHKADGPAAQHAFLADSWCPASSIVGAKALQCRCGVSISLHEQIAPLPVGVMMQAACPHLRMDESCSLQPHTLLNPLLLHTSPDFGATASWLCMYIT